MAGAWLREEQADLAAEKILEGAARAFIELGVSRAGMGEIAKYAGCSRGTLYRYFENRHELHLAFVNQCAVRLVAELRVELAEITDPEQRLVEYVVRAVQKVRRNPAMAAWFEPGESAMAARMSRGSEVIGYLADAFVSSLAGARQDKPSSLLRARWMVRVIVSLLIMPGDSEAEERILIARFVAPAMLSNEDAAPVHL
ncbi:MAG: TetR/AcrR family transcriptional regulator [Deltaproteobacteria bacterium]|nr:TetR/AcrR family transcriptional regulator [Deltaproteobacteria bacterium]MBW2724053.1 TetR/AcrR family transcriptional regulator [Deltaproteobacteria bacterium]